MKKLTISLFFLLLGGAAYRMIGHEMAILPIWLYALMAIIFTAKALLSFRDWAVDKLFHEEEHPEI